MKLDSRIIEGKKPLDCFDAENKELMKSFLNKEGYVSNNLENFCLLEGCFKRLLNNVFKKVKDCFKTSINGGDGGNWKYFLPAEWVKEPEKTYRAYTVMEFIKEYPLGSYLHFRPKSDTMEMHRLIDGYNDYKNGNGTLFMCGTGFSMSELYDNYEIYVDGVWKPFGVEE